MQVLTYVFRARFKSWYKEKVCQLRCFYLWLHSRLGNPVDIDSRVSAVLKFTSLPEASSLAAANKRVSNILSKQLSDNSAPDLDTDFLEEEAEQQLAASLNQLDKLIAPLLKSVITIRAGKLG